MGSVVLVEAASGKSPSAAAYGLVPRLLRRREVWMMLRPRPVAVPYAHSTIFDMRWCGPSGNHPASCSTCQTLGSRSCGVRWSHIQSRRLPSTD